MIRFPIRASSKFALCRALLISLALLATTPASAQDCAGCQKPPADVLNLDTSVTTELAPDLAVVVMAVNREGLDTAAMTQDINQVLAKAIEAAKATPGVQVASGGFTTNPRYDNKGQRNGWQMRAELVLKSKDFGSLGKLVGKLGANLEISGNSFELSPDLRTGEEAKMIAGVVAAFKAKADATTKAFGYSAYAIREVSLGQAMQGGSPRPMPMRMKTMAMAAEAAPMPIESGRVNLQLSISGSVQMRK